MSIEDAIKTVLVADADLMAVLSGGIYTPTDTGTLGITPATAPAAFDAAQKLKPCLAVRARGTNPVAGGPADRAVRAVRQVVVLYFRQHAADFEAIQDAEARVFQRLDGVVAGGAHIHYVGAPFGVQLNETELGGVNILTAEYETTRFKH